MSNGGIPNTKELMRELREQGWRLDRTIQGHYKAFSPDGHELVTFSDTNEPRAMKNCLAQLRRTNQFQWPPPDKRMLRRTSGERQAPVAEATGAPTDALRASAPKTSTLDDLFQNLKAAKAELGTMEEHHDAVMATVREAEAALEEAKRRAEMAVADARERARASREDLDVARRLVMEAKAAFDAAFEVSAA